MASEHTCARPGCGHKFKRHGGSGCTVTGLARPGDCACPRFIERTIVVDIERSFPMGTDRLPTVLDLEHTLVGQQVAITDPNGRPTGVRMDVVQYERTADTYRLWLGVEPHREDNEAARTLRGDTGPGEVPKVTFGFRMEDSSERHGTRFVKRMILLELAPKMPEPRLPRAEGEPVYEEHTYTLMCTAAHAAHPAEGEDGQYRWSGTITGDTPEARADAARLSAMAAAVADGWEVWVDPRERTAYTDVKCPAHVEGTPLFIRHDGTPAQDGDILTIHGGDVRAVEGPAARNRLFIEREMRHAAGEHEWTEVRAIDEPDVESRMCTFPGCGHRERWTGAGWEEAPDAFVSTVERESLTAHGRAEPVAETVTLGGIPLAWCVTCGKVADDRCARVHTLGKGPLVEAAEQQADPAVDHPSHYGGDTVYEAIKVIEAWRLGFALGNAVKYLSRAGRKPGEAEVKDLRKAVWYIERRIRQIEAGDG